MIIGIIIGMVIGCALGVFLTILYIEDQSSGEQLERYLYYLEQITL